MSQSIALSAESSPALQVVLDLASEYADAHGVVVRIWERSETGWVRLAPHADTPDEGPGASAVPLTLPGGMEACVETTHPDAAKARRSARFLARVLGAAAKRDLESRFFGRELAERYEEITLLYTISEVLGSVISLEEAAEKILLEVTDTMGVERAALWVHDPETDLLERVAAVGEESEEGSVSVNDDVSVTAVVFRSRTPMMLEPGQTFPRERGEQPNVRHDFFLSVPVSYTPPRGDTRTIGVINLIGRMVEESFSAGDQKLITAIASQIGAAIENSRLVAESLQQERLVREMELAHDLQLKLLPPTNQFREYCEVAARCVPADSVGGDFYHLFRLPEGRIGVMIGDVSSHGFAAALIMALTMSAVAIHASDGDEPAEVLRRVHRALIDELEHTEMYLTLFYGVIDPDRHRLTYASAGHPHAYVVGAEGAAKRLPVTSPPFGLTDLGSYEENTVSWTSGHDLLFLFTDGLSDAIDPSCGEELVIEQVTANRHRPVEEILQLLFDLEKRDYGIPADDRSALLLRT